MVTAVDHETHVFLYLCDVPYASDADGITRAESYVQHQKAKDPALSYVSQRQSVFKACSQAMPTLKAYVACIPSAKIAPSQAWAEAWHPRLGRHPQTSPSKSSRLDSEHTQTGVSGG